METELTGTVHGLGQLNNYIGVPPSPACGHRQTYFHCSEQRMNPKGQERRTRKYSLASGYHNKKDFCLFHGRKHHAKG